MNKYKKYAFWVLGAAALCGIFIVLAVVLGADGAAHTWTLRLPEAEDLTEISLNYGGETVFVADEDDMRSLLALLLGEQRSTREDSIQDAPVGADSVLQINFHFAKGASTVFVYEKRGRFYIEQPYNGIYAISKEEYGAVEAFAA